MLGRARGAAIKLDPDDEVTLGLVKKAATVRRVRASGPTLLARMLSLALLGDFVSLYLAALNGEDPYTIASIDLIKERLSKA